MTDHHASSSLASGPATGALTDGLSIWLTHLTVFSLPIMLLDPMDPIFHRLQFTELFFAPLVVLTAWRIALRGERVDRPSPFVLALIAFILVLYVAALGQPAGNIVEATKQLYLALLAWTIWHNGTRYGLAADLARWFGAAFATIVAGAVVGGLLLVAGWETFLAIPSRIVGIALGISHVVPVVPRVESFLQPTGNMLGVYFAVTTLPVASLAFRAQWMRGRPLLLAVALGIVVVLGFLTMSRAFVGVLLAVALGLLVLHWPAPRRRILGSATLAFAILTFLAMQAFTVFYPVNVNARYTTDPGFQKEQVDLRSKTKPNPVYFLRPGAGLETVELRLDFAFNHYAWLKYAGWRIFLDRPWLGAGPGGYSAAAQDLAASGDIDAEIAGYRGAQSQYFTLLAETGILGSGAFCLFVVLLVRRLRQAAGSAADYPLALPCLLGLVPLSIAALDIDLLAFRWLWGLYAIALLRWPAVPAALPVAVRQSA